MSLRPTSTSYALLGLLSVRPWSAYELAQQMTRSLRSLLASRTQRRLPRAETAGRHGIRHRHPAAERPAHPRCVPDHPSGREALGQWLATAPADPQIQMEPMLRLLFADSGAPDELAASLRALRASAERPARPRAPASAPTPRHRRPLPGRLDLIALFAEFFGQLYAITGDWAQRAKADIARLADRHRARPQPAHPHPPSSHRR